MTVAVPKRSVGSVVPVTDHISPDEKALKLQELNYLTDQYREAHRWQFIYVNRGGKLAVYITDMGLAVNWSHGEIIIVSNWEDSVAYLQEEANKMRFEDALTKLLQEAKAESTLANDWLRLRSEIWEQAHNRSHFGPRFRKQRNLFARSKV